MNGKLLSMVVRTLMTFIKKQANNVKVKTVSGKFVDLGVGNYEQLGILLIFGL